MHEKIQTLLKQIEKVNDVKILFGIENGSRSWEMASKDSDYDVRFVFYRPIENYLSLTPEKEVINIAFDRDLKVCDAQGSLIDMSGFDIFKYLKLLLASNPTTIEWLNSPIVYYGDNNIPLRNYMKDNFNQGKLFRHYFSLFRHNYWEFIQQGKAITYKKYLYSMRGLLNAKYTYEFNKIPPLKLRETVEELKNLIPDNIYKKTNKVIDIKSKGLEKDKILRIPEFDEFFNEELEKEKKYLIQNNKQPSAEVFNKFINQVLIQRTV